MPPSPRRLFLSMKKQAAKRKVAVRRLTTKDVRPTISISRGVWSAMEDEGRQAVVAKFKVIHEPNSRYIQDPRDEHGMASKYWNDLPDWMKAIRIGEHNLLKSPEVVKIVNDAKAIGIPLDRVIERLERATAKRLQALGLPWNVAISHITDEICNS